MRDNLTLDFGRKNVETLDGVDDGNDYVALRAGFQYFQPDRNDKASGRYETRFGEVETEHVLQLGRTLKASEAVTLFARERYLFETTVQFRRRYADRVVGSAARAATGDGAMMAAMRRWRMGWPAVAVLIVTVTGSGVDHRLELTLKRKADRPRGLPTTVPMTAVPNVSHDGGQP